MTEKIYIFDTTLRDGEQSPGASMNLDEKLQIAEVLDSMKVDIIEAGFPIASNGDFEAVSEVSKYVKNSTIAGLARASFKDIDRAWEAVQHAKSPRIHTFIATSPLHMKYKLKKTEDEVLGQFMSLWDTQEKDGIVSKSEFTKYYSDISASVDDDEMFALIITNAWDLDDSKK